MGKSKRLPRTVTMGGKLLFPNDYVSAAEFAGKDYTLTIREVKIEGVQTDDGKESKPVLFFVETKKKLILNRTNSESIATMYGGAVEGWPGKRITLFPATTSAFGATVDCVRIREKVPPARGAASNTPPDQDGEAFAEHIAGDMAGAKS